MTILGIGSRINHPDHGKGVVTNLTGDQYWVTFMDKGLEVISINDTFEVIEVVRDEVDAVSLYEVERVLTEVLQKWGDTHQRVALADKWKGGKLVLEPTSGAAKEMPIDTFFHKIVMVRDRLRVMEQKINSSPQLEDVEKVEFQQYITRIYGSLTSFNLLFKN